MTGDGRRSRLNILFFRVRFANSIFRLVTGDGRGLDMTFFNALYTSFSAEGPRGENYELPSRAS